MELLQYIVEDSTIAELLGVQNFTNKESAVLELVKNAYDAQAKNIQIVFASDSITIVDDGIGMDKTAIRENWMHVGKSDKGYTLPDNTAIDNRVLAGSKGVGRFALARLGSLVTVYSSKASQPQLKWTTDWEKSILDDCDDELDLATGTKIVITQLRDRWTDKAIKKLINYLSVTCNDSKMNISVFPNDGKDVSYIFSSPALGENYVSQINLSYDASKAVLHCSILNDEFEDAAQRYCPDINLSKFERDIVISDEFLGDNELDLTQEELERMLCEVGSFTAELFFSLKSTTAQDCESFCYKHSNLDHRYDCGVVLYRNAFSISSFEGGKDWLELNKRSRKSPAAATHITGSWRVRGNQLSGMVQIDKSSNSYLRELGNRQGLEENDHFTLFVKIITAGISFFERYRQTIIRSINKKNAPPPAPATPIIDQILKGKHKHLNLSESDVVALANEISSVKEETKSFRTEKETTEQRYRYDVRILNVLSTTGLKASSIAHELKNDRNSISVNYDFIVAALKEYGFWDDLNSPECTEYAYKNIPQLLRRNSNINQKVVAFMDTMLDEIEKKRFAPSLLCVKEIVKKIKENWKRDYSSLNISLDIDDDLFYKTSEDVFTVIFDNLVLNSWQQNKNASKIDIDIIISKVGNHLKVVYADFGVGLSPKYINDPRRILAVHESSRANGHGLGMWIVNNTIQMTGGEVLNIDGHGGFRFTFDLGDKI